MFRGITTDGRTYKVIVPRMTLGLPVPVMRGILAMDVKVKLGLTKLLLERNEKRCKVLVSIHTPHKIW